MQIQQNIKLKILSKQFKSTKRLFKKYSNKS